MKKNFYFTLTLILSLVCSYAGEKNNAAFVPLKTGEGKKADEKENPRMISLMDSVRDGKQFLVGNHHMGMNNLEKRLKVAMFPFNMTGVLSSGSAKYYPNDQAGEKQWEKLSDELNIYVQELHKNNILYFYQLIVKNFHRKKLHSDEEGTFMELCRKNYEQVPDKIYPCFNNPSVRERAGTAAEMIFSRINVDGVYFEEPFAAASDIECHCPICREKFRHYLLKRYGSVDAVEKYFGQKFETIRSVPSSERMEKRKIWYEWFRFVQESRIEYLKFIGASARAAAEKYWGKNIVVTGSIGYNGIQDHRNMRISELMDGNVFSGIFHAYYWQCFGDNYEKAKFKDVDFRQYHKYLSWDRSQTRGKPIWLWAIAQDEPGWVFEIETYSSVIGGASGVTPFIPSAETEDGMKRALSFVLANNEIIMGAKPLSPVALYYSHEQFNYKYYGYRTSDTFEKNYGGSWFGLMNSHIPAEFISNDIPMDIKKYKVLIMSGIANMSEKEADNIRNWVGNGGVLIAFGPVSGSNIYEEPLTKPLLSDVFGIESAFNEIEADNLNYGSQKLSYCLQTTEGIQTQRMLALHNAWTFQRKPETELLAAWDASPQKPAMIKNRFGKGTAMLFGGFYSALPAEFREKLIRGEVMEALNGKFPVELKNFPKAGDMNFFRKGNKITVHLLNLEEVKDKIRKASPVKNIGISVKLPADMKIRKVFALSPDFPEEKEIMFTIENGRAEMTLPELQLYTILVLEGE